ncbi:peptidase inhibitor family I36 protein [Streptomyces sp. NPDC057623]|uniref:peptidase inhibitor family I36 protein n=1 Tax=Streptomyces sp. NPDC057623 TaxID=3346187 RepID=UPI003678C3C1
MGRSTLALLAAGAAVAATLALPGTASAAAPSGCSEKHVCFYTGKDYSGKVCMWSAADPDWQEGAIKCSWAKDSVVKSIYNNGTSSNWSGVAYYLEDDYEDRVGCTKQGKGGNLAGTYKVRSHQWIKGSCGS